MEILPVACCSYSIATNHFIAVLLYKQPSNPSYISERTGRSQPTFTYFPVVECSLPAVWWKNSPNSLAQKSYRNLLMQQTRRLTFFHVDHILTTYIDYLWWLGLCYFSKLCNYLQLNTFSILTFPCVTIVPSFEVLICNICHYNSYRECNWF